MTDEELELIKKRSREMLTRPAQSKYDSTIHISKAYNKPLKSVGIAVHPIQAQEFTDAARKDGNTGVHYDSKTGKAVFTSRGARRRELKRRGLHDADGGYSD